MEETKFFYDLVDPKKVISLPVVNRNGSVEPVDVRYKGREWQQYDVSKMVLYGGVVICFCC